MIYRKISRPIMLLTNAYRKIEANDLDFALSYPSNDEMGKLCNAFEKMKECLAKNNETMFRQFAEQRRLNAAFSHDLRTPLTLLKGHATMLLSFIPKGLVSQEEIIEEISVMSKNVSRLEKYVNAMTNLYRLEDIEISRQHITFYSFIDNLNDTAELLCCDKHFSITTSGENAAVFINLDAVMQIYENLLSNSIRYAKSDIAISVVIKNNDLVISVSDDGCGFKNSDIEKATLPFYKSSKDISTEHLGLGLNICKILSERHGGNIQIANNKAGGACVTVKINCSENSDNHVVQDYSEEYEFSPYGNEEELDALDDLKISMNTEKDCIIKPDKRLTLEIDVKSFYGELPAGHYRFIKQFTFFENERDWDYDTYNLSYEFTIR